jgi:hypothetical protein
MDSRGERKEWRIIKSKFCFQISAGMSYESRSHGEWDGKRQALFAVRLAGLAPLEDGNAAATEAARSLDLIRLSFQMRACLISEPSL